MTNREKLYNALNNLSYKALKLYFLLVTEKGLPKVMDYKDRYMELFGLSSYSFYEAKRELYEKGYLK